jgi:hypothetical protein
MKKNFWILTAILLFCLTRSGALKAQSDTLYLHQVYPSFSNQEKAEWTAFENNWNYFKYQTIKKQLNVANLSCKSCESLYADVFIRINATGTISVIRFISGKKCGVDCNEKAFIELFESSLRKQQFNSLKNKQFIARFGNILKC